ncbi:MAG TPA: sigma factor [Streptosporangiaceae bacterium]|nr:sigma factor [Streptosporangiaceae bacterium]
MIGFEESAVPLRGELLAHCYRMLGSWDEAEDAVQETYLRGWRARDGFDQRASVRTWLHRIATNVCLNAVRDRGRRAPCWTHPWRRSRAASSGREPAWPMPRPAPTTWSSPLPLRRAGCSTPM